LVGSPLLYVLERLYPAALARSPYLVRFTSSSLTTFTHSSPDTNHFLPCTTQLWEDSLLGPLHTLGLVAFVTLNTLVPWTVKPGLDFHYLIYIFIPSRYPRRDIFYLTA
jgi:hypothetical protein